jgi:DNA-binding MarR family transcriptional regulator
MIPINIQDEELLQQTLDRFWETFPPMWNAIRSHLRTIVTENFEITVEQFHILRHIRKGTGSVSELATAQHISRPAISQAVDALVNKGLITRHQDTEDRRFVNLGLTPDGNTLLDAIFAKNRYWMAEKLAILTSEEVGTTLQALESLKRAFSISNG